MKQHRYRITFQDGSTQELQGWTEHDALSQLDNAWRNYVAKVEQLDRPWYARIEMCGN